MTDDPPEVARAAARRPRKARGIGPILSALVVGVVACSSAADVEVPNADGKEEGAACVDGAECMSLVCSGGRCTAVSGGACDGRPCTQGRPDDGAKNGDETDVDCGGSRAPKCDVGKGCNAHGDCASDACSYAKRCVAFKSCTGHFGGDTCGPGETGTPEAEHESCCATVSSDRGTVGKYQVTAGRMRAFVERFDGDLQAWAATGPKGWDDSWNDALPSSMEEALFALGPAGKRGCGPETQGARTYWQPPIDGDDAQKSDFSKDVLDEKALNCVTWYLAQALCVFDGGRLASQDELVDLMTNGGTTEYPWGFQDTRDYDVRAQDDRIVHNYSYATPNPPPDMRREDDGTPLDRGFFIAPPGRRPKGADAYGAMDAVGNMLPWVNDEPGFFLYTISWENHPKKTEAEYWKGKDGTDAYYAIGARCAFP